MTKKSKLIVSLLTLGLISSFSMSSYAEMDLSDDSGYEHTDESDEMLNSHDDSLDEDYAQPKKKVKAESKKKKIAKKRVKPSKRSKKKMKHKKDV